MSYQVIVQILGRSPQGFTPFEILDHLLALPHYQGRSRSSIFAELLPVLQSLRDSQEVAHVSPRWVLVEAQEKTSEELSNESTEQNLTESTLAIEQEAYPVVDISLDFANPVMTVEKPKETNNVNNAAFDFPIEILNLSKRAYHSLKRTRINTVTELQSYSDEYLLTIDGFGQTSLDDVKSVLASVILWIIDFIPEIHSIQISAEKFFYIAPFTSQVFENIQACLSEFWTEQRFSDRSQLHEIILPLLPQDILNSEQVVDTLIKTCCNEPIMGVFSAEKWNLADYAYYALHQAGKPLHFNQIGERLVNLIPNWDVSDPSRAAQSYVDRHPDIIRCGSGIYGLRDWGTMEYGHFREVLLDYLSKQSLPVDPEDIYGDLSQLYSVTRATVSMNLNLHPNLFHKFGRSNLYGVAGRRYELPEQNLINLLVAKLEASPISLSSLEEDADLAEYDFKTIYLYLNISPLFCQTASMNERKFALSIEGKRHYEPGETSTLVENIFNQIREPLHARDLLHFIRNYYAYPPGESAFSRILSEGKDYINIAEGIFIPRYWMNDETLNPILEDLDTELFREIVLFTLGSKRNLPTSETLFNWLNLCYRNRFFYRGSLIYAQVNLGELSDKKAQAVRQIGKVCQRNGDTSVLAIEQDANSEEVDRSLRLELEDLRQQAQSAQRTLSKGLASVQDGKYRVRYVGVGVEVHITKYGGTDNPCARVLQVLVNSEPYTYRNTSSHSFVLSGSRATPATLFFNQNTRKVGILGQKDVVFFDEIAHTEFSDAASTISVLKDYMQTGRFSRGNHEYNAQASIVLGGNIDTDIENKKPIVSYKHFFSVLPVDLQDTAFLDRIHAFLPGWEMPKIRTENYAQGYGFITDYLAEIFNRLRRTNYSISIEKYAQIEGLTSRNQTAIKKTAAGLLKLIYPHQDIDSIQYEEYSLCIRHAIEHRSRVIDQLAVMAPEEFSSNSLASVLSF